LASVTTRRFVIFKSSQGDLYGSVADGRFEEVLHLRSSW